MVEDAQGPDVLGALDAAAESGSAYDPERTPLSEAVKQFDVSSLYSPDGPTKKAAKYETETTTFDAPENPRQADRASDTGGLGGKVARIAQQYVGVPYVWGGMTPSGFDCSGLLQYVFAKVGVKLPRMSYQQARTGTRIPLSQARAGDIIGWDLNDRNNGADHVALSLGGGLILEAPRPGVPVRVRHLSPDEGAWATRVL